ncbi:MAG: hypothetical protein MH204_05235 [Fimbriimonadaceae bacterium]|nr:hypothetical protein [Fimbriimonadaceae bacterium]
MGRKPSLILLVFAAATIIPLTAGCNDVKTETVNEPYRPSSPPPGWLEERQQRRDQAPAPGPGAG